jgi:pre-mRNA-splicing factor SPF27
MADTPMTQPAQAEPIPSVAPAYHESLPYTDAEPSAEALAAARALISAEASSSSAAPPPATHPSSAPPVPSNPLDLSRYEAQELPPPSTSTQDAAAAAAAAAAALSSAYTSSSYLASRTAHLRLLDHAPSGRNAWLLANHQLESLLLKPLERDLAATEADIDRLNAHRRDRQLVAGAEIASLERDWKAAVGRALETEVAVEELREQIREEMRLRAAAEAQAGI